MPRRVLVIDDEPDMLTLVQVNLELEGFEVVGAKDGEEGLRLLEELRPDAAVLDLNLPLADGFQVLLAARANPATERIPIVLLTARSRFGDEATAMAVGADAFVNKPFSGRGLVKTIQSLVDLPTDELLARRLAHRHEHRAA